MILEKIKSEKDDLNLSVSIIEPKGEAKGIVQISHGMAEHKERYYDFMKYLSENGYICVIHDHRGHGASVKDEKDLGYFYSENIDFIVDDLYKITKYIKNKYLKYTLITILSALIIIIGTSRIYLGVHYTSDVIAGFLISISYLVVYTSLTKRFIQNTNRNV